MFDPIFKPATFTQNQPQTIGAPSGSKAGSALFFKPGGLLPVPGATPLPAPPPPATIAPGYECELPGERVSGSGPFTEADRHRFRVLLEQREADNRKNVGAFLNAFVHAAVSICGQFVSQSMSEAAKKAGLSDIQNLLKIAFSEALPLIATGGASVFARPLISKGLAAGLKFLADKAAAQMADQLGDSWEDDLRSAALDTRQKALNQLTASVASHLGAFTEEMVQQHLGGNFSRRGYCLRDLPLSDLNKFRIPELFPLVDPAKIRVAVAGVVAGLAQSRQPSPIVTTRAFHSPNYIQGAVQFYDDNIVIVNTTTTVLQSVQFHSSSPVLSREIIGLSTIRDLPSVPLFIAVHASAGDDRQVAGKLVSAARGSSAATAEETAAFLAAWPIEYKPMLIKRGKNKTFEVLDGSLSQLLWAYQWATGDTELTKLGAGLMTWQFGENELRGAPDQGTDGYVSEIVHPDELARKAAMWLPGFGPEGARKFVEKVILNLKPGKADDRYDAAYLLKYNSRNPTLD